MGISAFVCSRTTAFELSQPEKPVLWKANGEIAPMSRSLVLAALFTLLNCAVFAGELPTTPEQVRPLPVGSHAPTPMLRGADGRDFDLAAAIAGKPTVLIFYRGGWCPFCNRHLAALADIEIDLRTLGFQLFGITPDEPAQLNPTAKENRVRYRLLSDRGMQAAGAYGVAFRLTQQSGEDYRKNGIVLPPAPDGLGFWQPVPAAFIIARDGTIRFVYSNPDPENSIEAKKLLAAAREAAK